MLYVIHNSDVFVFTSRISIHSYLLMFARYAPRTVCRRRFGVTLANLEVEKLKNIDFIIEKQ